MKSYGKINVFSLDLNLNFLKRNFTVFVSCAEKIIYVFDNNKKVKLYIRMLYLSIPLFVWFI